MDTCECGSFAINLHLYGRGGADDTGKLCDVCYWRDKCNKESIKLSSLLDTVLACLVAVHGEPVTDLDELKKITTSVSGTPSEFILYKLGQKDEIISQLTKELAAVKEGGG